MKKLFSFLLLLSFTIKAQEIKIGNQTWTTKNLDVTTYRNGDAIPQVQDKKAWANLITGAWCYYDNDASSGATYGKLYNWYAVNDSRGLAPKGYHIPTDKQWTKLINNLGGKEIAGIEMKSTIGWNNDGNGTNSSGLLCLPGGSRDFENDFDYVGDIGIWWSSSHDYTIKAWGLLLGCVNGSVLRASLDKQNGFSVRCIKD